MFVLKLTIQKQMSLNHISNRDSYADLDQMTIIHSQMAQRNLVKYASVISGSPQNFDSKFMRVTVIKDNLWAYVSYSTGHRLWLIASMLTVEFVEK